MAITKVEEWNETAASNVELDGIPTTSGGMYPSDARKFAQEIMSQVAAWVGDDTVASAATTDLGSVPGRVVTVSGSVTMTALGTIKAGTIKLLKFTGAPLLTHNGTSLILPDAANIQAAAGDRAIVVSEGSGNWSMWSYQRASKNDLGMELIEVIDATGLSFVDFAAIRPDEFASFHVVADDIQADGTGGLLVFRVMSGAPPSQEATNIYRWQVYRWTLSATGQTGAVSDTVVSLHSGETSGDGSAGMKANLVFDLATPGANNKQCTWSMGGLWESGSFTSVRGDGYVATATTVTGLRFFFANSSLFNTGTFRLYGLRK